ncbi:MAG: hypothetical protein UX80_C0005G0017 [Candidatus Amesbacteria bacterium GW2011_GWA2_47_11b]|uniref:Uncharacterized protein n=3 Tax=Candidatus Amesiibacteriota TaxID=1752730 RepID=A0A0G1VG43_9BACT|nr:MAG: hypothetical protein UX42_C0001G0075 [Microgenomates group bacterium GW2011_GWC1_46_20]KKU58197.1 MAG: hypothetical protein UX80_C0005G0017 [Candidatus Amesbacteria bacterium GW2011_GWA2_47_11b]KKU68990.1 MAG: hypothetical protein UX92_C0016G0015 [Candidatus Amesbacteria bacterium GW2011_GWA1_47_20]KKU83370.1 MAG: hypothetical protein UY11_C0021G0010 [Candidatus Amesbacteria bacterium GW2011_GWC2_47_8]
MTIAELAKMADDPIGSLLDLFGYPSENAPQAEREMWVAKMMGVAVLAGGAGLLGWIAIVAH